MAGNVNDIVCNPVINFSPSSSLITVYQICGPAEFVSSTHGGLCQLDPIQIQLK